MTQVRARQALQAGQDVVEKDSWGMDCYTRRNLFDAILESGAFAHLRNVQPAVPAASALSSQASAGDPVCSQPVAAAGPSGVQAPVPAAGAGGAPTGSGAAAGAAQPDAAGDGASIPGQPAAPAGPSDMQTDGGAASGSGREAQPSLASSVTQTAGPAAAAAGALGQQPAPHDAAGPSAMQVDAPAPASAAAAVQQQPALIAPKPELSSPGDAAAAGGVGTSGAGEPHANGDAALAEPLTPAKAFAPVPIKLDDAPTSAAAGAAAAQAAAVERAAWQAAGKASAAESAAPAGTSAPSNGEEGQARRPVRGAAAMARDMIVATTFAEASDGESPVHAAKRPRIEETRPAVGGCVFDSYCLLALACGMCLTELAVHCDCVTCCAQRASVPRQFCTAGTRLCSTHVRIMNTVKTATDTPRDVPPWLAGTQAAAQPPPALRSLRLRLPPSPPLPTPQRPAHRRLSPAPSAAKSRRRSRRQRRSHTRPRWQPAPTASRLWPTFRASSRRSAWFRRWTSTRRLKRTTRTAGSTRCSCRPCWRRMRAASTSPWH